MSAPERKHQRETLHRMQLTKQEFGNYSMQNTLACFNRSLLSCYTCHPGRRHEMGLMICVLAMGTCRSWFIAGLSCTYTRFHPWVFLYLHKIPWGQIPCTTVTLKRCKSCRCCSHKYIFGRDGAAARLKISEAPLFPKLPFKKMQWCKKRGQFSLAYDYFMYQ